MFRRDPLRLTLEQVGEALGRDTTSLLPLARQALGHGGVIGVSRAGRQQVWGAGGVPGSGVFELASVTKPFTSALAASLIQDGRLTWDTPIRSLGPEFRGLPGHFTPYSLATHTAGLPIHPARAVMTSVMRFHDPYGSMSPRDVLASARRWGRATREPRFSYSNLGAGVLALALAQAAGEETSSEGFERALRKRILVPWQLGSVTLSPHPAELVTPRAVMGGESATSFGPLVGAGGLFGAAQDLLTFAERHLSGHLGRHPGSHWHWAQARNVAGLIPPYSAVAPGWFHSAAQGGPVVWHDGVARGTRAALGFHPSSGRVVTVLVRGGIPLLGQRAAVPLLLLKLLGADLSRK